MSGLLSITLVGSDDRTIRNGRSETDCPIGLVRNDVWLQFRLWRRLQCRRLQGPGYMRVNGRIALRHIKFGPAKAERSAWAKTLTDRKEAHHCRRLAQSTSANFIPLRTHSRDLSVDF